MKKTVKIITILLVAIMLTTFATSVFAADVSFDSLSANYQGNSDKLVSKANNIMGLIRNVAIIASVIILMVLGVKYMLGSVEEKAEYKKSFVPLIVGIVLVVSATAVASFIFNMAA